MVDISNSIKHCTLKMENISNQIQEVDKILSSNPYAQVPYLVHQNNQLLKENLTLITQQNDLIEFYNKILKLMNSQKFVSFSENGINHEQQIIIDQLISFYEEMYPESNHTLYKYLKDTKNNM